MDIPEEKILVFDADVLIHFMQAESFSELRNIYPKNKKIILQKVYDELQIYKKSKVMLDSAIHTLKYIEIAPFPLSSEMMKEFAHLTSSLMDMGKGESACMSYCKFTHDVIVSSNLRDVGEYCKRHEIDLLTTMDLIKWALDNDLWTEKVCNRFITKVIKKGGKLPFKSINDYVK